MKKNVPRYQSLRDELLEDIRKNFTPGDRFHTQRDIMSSCKLGYATVEKALNMLVQEGWLVRHQGRGSFVSQPVNPGSNLLGVLVPSLDNHFYAQILKGAMTESQEAGYNLMVCDTLGSPDMEKRLFSRLIADNQVAGFLLCLQDRSNNSPIVQELQSRGIPSVLLPTVDFVEAAGLDYVVTDDEEGAYLAGKKLIEAGCRKLALIGPKRDSGTLTGNRVRGFLRALREEGVPFNNDLWIRTDSWEKADGTQAAEKLIQQAGEFDGIFALNDLLAIGVLLAFREKGYQFGGDSLRLIGFDDNDIADWPEISLTTVRQPRAEIGSLAMKMLLQRCRGEKPENNQISLKPELVLRSTC